MTGRSLVQRVALCLAVVVSLGVVVLLLVASPKAGAAEKAWAEFDPALTRERYLPEYTMEIAMVGQTAEPNVLKRERYLPEYTQEGDLILPKNWRTWVFVGSPLTPDALNDGKAGFPEYHNVYMEPGSYEIYKKTGQFPEGTIMFKELQRVLGPQQFPDGSMQQPSGRGYFPGAMNGADVTVKDTKRYAATGGWGYFNFNHHEPKAETAKVRPNEECHFCHIASAKKDFVWTQFYRELDN